MRWLLVLVIVIVGCDSKKKTEPAKGSAVASGSAEPKPNTPAPELPAVNAQQEEGERKVVTDFAGELKVTDAEREKLVAAMTAMQEGRRTLFADLAEKKIAVEIVSKQLGELRATMNKSFENDLGAERAKKLIDKLREAHGAQAPQ